VYLLVVIFSIVYNSQVPVNSNGSNDHRHSELAFKKTESLVTEDVSCLEIAAEEVNQMFSC